MTFCKVAANVPRLLKVPVYVALRLQRVQMLGRATEVQIYSNTRHLLQPLLETGICDIFN